MSGGSLESTMGNWAGIVYDSGFTESNLPGGSNASKYYEKYTGISSGMPTSTISIKGDATYETMWWYYDDPFFILDGYPWSSRGGSYNYTTSAGIYRYDYNFGSGSGSVSFRVSLIP